MGKESRRIPLRRGRGRDIWLGRHLDGGRGHGRYSLTDPYLLRPKYVRISLHARYVPRHTPESLSFLLSLLPGSGPRTRHLVLYRRALRVTSYCNKSLRAFQLGFISLTVD